MKDLEIKNVPISKLNYATYNPRKDLQPTDIEYKCLERSIDEFGYVDPIIWNETTGNVVGGHQRLKILIAKGVTEVNVSVVNLDDKQEKALNIALNKISGEWDEKKLEELLIELSAEIDISIMGFTDAELESMFKDSFCQTVTEDEAFDVNKALSDKPLSCHGDIWVLGEHSLMCGDSTKMDDVKLLMGYKRVNLVFTDPPYNVNYAGKTEDKLTIQNDNMVDDEFFEFLQSASNNYYSVMEDGASIYVCHAASEAEKFLTAFRQAGLKLSQTIIWVKDVFVLGRQDYHWTHKPILYGWKEGVAHYFIDDRKQDAVWKIPKPQKNREHPTMKPLELCGTAIQNSSKSGELVADFFGGSGSTLIASEQLKRIAYLMELDPKYCDVIVKRYISFVGCCDSVRLFRDGQESPIGEFLESIMSQVL